jgi:phenylacetate-CoA ligase
MRYFLKKQNSRCFSFDLSLQLNGFPYKGKAQLHTIINLSETDFVTFVENQKKKKIHFHLKHNSFYGDFAKEALF